MVRLKELHPHSFFSYRYISIPYGAIKRTLVKNLTKPVKEISIPYGAIKSHQAGLVSLFRPGGFQFLMVRLKVPSSEINVYLFKYFNSLWCD